MKKLLFTALLIFFNSALFSQDYNFLDKGLKKMTSIPKQLSLNDLDIFLHTGEKLEAKDLMDYAANSDYRAIIFCDQDDVPKAMVFEVQSEEAKEAIRRNPNIVKRGPEPFERDSTVPDFKLKDLDGNDFVLSELKGEYVMLNFWFVGCKPCVIEMPELNELVEKYESKGIHFIAIGLDNESRTKNFLERQPFNYRLLPNGRRVAQDFGVTGYPTHLLLDQESKVIFSQVGYSTTLKQRLVSKLDEVVNN